MDKKPCYMCNELGWNIYTLWIERGFFKDDIGHELCQYCHESVKEKNIGKFFYTNIRVSQNQFEKIMKHSGQIKKDSMEKHKIDKKKSAEQQEKNKKAEIEHNKKMENGIINLLKKHGTKMPASDIDAHLKNRDVDQIKEFCEKMYFGGKINRTSNYRYFVLSDEKKLAKKVKPKTASTDDVVNELEKYKKMIDKGLITEEDYNAKKKELLGL